MRILITGGRGMLGSDLCDALQGAHVCRPVGSAEADVTSLAKVSACVAQEQPDLIIHAAAYTDVDGCERDPDRAFRVNALGTWNVATAAESNGCALIVISTDFVFDGAARVPYTEFDAPHPINQYGASKRAGEEMALLACPRCSIIRTQWLYGPRGNCFPDAILRAAAAGRPLRVVADQIGAPTYTRDLSAKIAALLRAEGGAPSARSERGARGSEWEREETASPVPSSTPRSELRAPSAPNGRPPRAASAPRSTPAPPTLLPIYHINNAGVCSWHEFAVAILGGSGADGQMVEPISSDAWPSPTRRPAYSVLRRYALELTGQDDLRPWQDALGEYLAARRP